MKRILICTGVLGGGTAAVFAVAALAATLAPAGQLVPGNWQQTGVMRGGPVMFSGGVVTVTGTVGVGNASVGNASVGNAAVDLPAIAPAVGPVTVQPVGTEVP